jgi:hypothetical protein
MTGSVQFREALRRFAGAITGKMTQVTVGAPEDQVRGPFEHLMSEFGAAFGRPVVCTGETPLPDRLGRPDYADRGCGRRSVWRPLRSPAP